MKQNMLHPSDPPHQIAPAVIWEFQWVESYLKSQAIRAELEELTAERNRILSARPPKSESAEQIKEAFKAYQERRIEAISKYLETYGGPDAFRYFGDSFPAGNRTVHVPPYLTLEEVKAAFDRMPSPADAMSAKARDKAAEKLMERIEQLEMEMVRAFPHKYQGENGADIRAEFLSYWIDVQRRACEPVRVTGENLEKFAGDAEKEAWKRLKLGDFMNTRTGKLGYDPS